MPYSSAENRSLGDIMAQPRRNPILYRAILFAERFNGRLKHMSRRLPGTPFQARIRGSRTDAMYAANSILMPWPLGVFIMTQSYSIAVAL